MLICWIIDCIGLSLNMNDNNAGLGLKFELLCNNCDYKFKFMNSSVHQTGCFIMAITFFLVHLEIKEKRF
jgi:hypothetical protein